MGPFFYCSTHEQRRGVILSPKNPLDLPLVFMIGSLIMQEKEMDNVTMAQTFSVLIILYNCVQRKECLPLILSEVHLSDSLAAITSCSNIEIRFLSKLVLGFLSQVLSVQQCGMLKLQPDETSFLLSSLHSISQSPDGEHDGYSAIELLQGLLNFSKIKENFLTCLDPAMEIIFGVLLEYNKPSYHSLILQIIWNVFSASGKAESFLSIIPAIKALKSTETRTLQNSILFLIQQKDTGRQFSHLP